MSDAVGKGLEAVRSLCSPEAWRETFQSEGSRAWSAAVSAIEALYQALPPDSPYRRLLRERIGVLLELLQAEPVPTGELPDQVVDAARAALLPAPLSASSSRAAPGPDPEGSPPPKARHEPPRARAIAAGGGGLDWNDGGDLQGACRQTTDSLAEREQVLAAFIVDRDGKLLAGSGGQNLSNRDLAAATAPAAVDDDVLRRFLIDGQITLGSAAGSLHLRLLGGRLILTVITSRDADPGDIGNAAVDAAKPVEAALRGSNASPLQLTDLARLFRE